MGPDEIIEALVHRVPTGEQDTRENIPLPQLQVQAQDDIGTHITIFSTADDPDYHERLVEDITKLARESASVTRAPARTGYPLAKPRHEFLTTNIFLTWR